MTATEGSAWSWRKKLCLDRPCRQALSGRLSGQRRQQSRSAVVNEALRLLEQRENERALELAYRQSAPSDLVLAQEFQSSLQDGLAGPSDETW